MYLGKRIKELRIKKGLTQLELAKTLFVNDRTVSKWEQEKGNPDINVIPSLANALDVSIDFLMIGKEHVPNLYKIKNDGIKYFEMLINQEIDSDYARRLISRHIDEYDLEAVKNAMDICYETYLSKSEKPYTSEKIRSAVKKIGGILHNQSLSPLEKKISHLISFLAKNTIKSSPKLKLSCEATIKEYLIVAQSHTDEQKIEIIEKFHKYCAKNKLDLYRAIDEVSRVIEAKRTKDRLNKRIETGFIKIYEEGSADINCCVEEINQSIRDNETDKIPKLIIKSFDTTMKTIISSLDKEINTNEIPHLTSYYNRIYSIFGRFVGKRNSRIIADLVSTCLTDAPNISYTDLVLLNNLINELLHKLNRHYKTGINNYDASFFRKG